APINQRSIDPFHYIRFQRMHTMWKTVVFLIGTLIVVPIAAYLYDTPPSDHQVQVMGTVGMTYFVLASLCFVVSIMTQNYSQVDKLWSVAPIAYGWQIAFLSHWEPRMILIASLITLWGARLTFNFARRGGYSWKFWTGEEDYRWSELRKRPGFTNRFVWSLFNLFFICGYQGTLIFLFTLPILSSLNTHSSPLQWYDILLYV